MATDKPVVPLDIIKIILSKLSSKSLVRFKTVSKSWNTMISDDLVFARTHLHRSKYSNSHNLFLRQSKFGSCTLLKLLEDGKFRTVQQLKGPDNFDKVLCFCDGMLLLTELSYRKFMLWNPSTRMETKLSAPRRFERGLSYGLCHDPAIAVFTIVIIYENVYVAFMCTRGGGGSLMTRDFKYSIISTGLEMSTSPVSVDGVVYWVIKRRHTEADRVMIRYEIVYFDPEYNKFKILQKPENIVDEEGEEQPIYLIDLRGCLCVYCNIGGDMKTVKIWIKGKGMDNSCWNELVTIENVDTPISLFKPLCFVGNKILVELLSNSRLLLYNPLERTFEEVEDITMFYGLVPYMDSMFVVVEKIRLPVRGRGKEDIKRKREDTKRRRRY